MPGATIFCCWPSGFWPAPARNTGCRPTRLDSEAQARLLAYEWPGNIRELANAIERAAVFTDTAAVTAESLGSLQTHDDGASPAPRAEAWTGRDEAMRQELLAALEEVGGNISHAAARLGVARNTVYARLEKFGLRPDHPHKAASGAHRPAAPATGSRRSLRQGFDGSGAVLPCCVWT